MRAETGGATEARAAQDQRAPRAAPYDPRAVEAAAYERWLAAGYGRAGADDAARAKAPYVILMPPPNVTGVLHVGHVLNNTIQDALIRWQRMKGRDALW